MTQLSAICYSEFAVEFPLVGGGFLYTMMTFGELPAALCAVNLFVDYIFGTSSVVRNLSSYWAFLFTKAREAGGKPPARPLPRVPRPGACATRTAQRAQNMPKHNFFEYKEVKPSLMTDGTVDYVGLLVTLFLAIVCSYSTKIFDDSNKSIQFLHIMLVIITFVAAFSNKNSTSENWHPFYDDRLGSPSTMVIAGAANIFFVFIGYDVISARPARPAASAAGRPFHDAARAPLTPRAPGRPAARAALGAEEAKTPAAVPRGMVLAIFVVTGLYICMACALVMLVPWHTLQFQPSSVVCAYAYAFEVNNMHWARYIVALGATVGIITSTGIGLYGMARVIQVFARERLLPPIVGAVSPRFGTPLYATMFSGAICGLFAFFSNFTVLANMTSIGTLIMFWFVALALLYRRYGPGIAQEAGFETGDRELKQPMRFDPFKRFLKNDTQRCYLVLFWIAIICVAPLVFTIYFNASTEGIWAQNFAGGHSSSTTTTSDGVPGQGGGNGNINPNSVFSAFDITVHVAGAPPGTPAAFKEVVPQFQASLSPSTRKKAMIAMAVIWGGATLGLQLTCPIAYVPEKWSIPFWAMPWLPSMSVWTITMLVGGFGGFPGDYARLGYCVVAMMGVYFVYASFPPPLLLFLVSSFSPLVPADILVLPVPFAGCSHVLLPPGRAGDAGGRAPLRARAGGGEQEGRGDRDDSGWRGGREGRGGADRGGRETGREVGAAARLGRWYLEGFGGVRLSRVHGASAPIQCCEGEISYFANGAALDPTSSGNERFT